LECAKNVDNICQKVKRKMIDILKELSEAQALIMIKSANLRKKYEEILILRYVENKSVVK
jgi:hypothetical protein